MNYDLEHTTFSKSVLAGLFSGLIATMLCLLYNAIFRSVTVFSLSELINISTISFSILLSVTIAGLIFYSFDYFFKNGILLFKIVSLVITGILVLLCFQVNRTQILIFNIDFRQLLSGIVLITGLCIAGLIPFFFKHDYI